MRASGRGRVRIFPPIALTLALALPVAACGDDAAPDTSAVTVDASPITVPLTEENGSGRSGEARLEPDGDAIRVTLSMNAGPTNTNNAHIHDVTCEQYRSMDDFSEQLGTVKDSLRSVRDGTSETIVKTSLAGRATGGFSINVHEPAHPYVVVACGDIPQP